MKEWEYSPLCTTAVQSLGVVISGGGKKKNNQIGKGKIGKGNEEKFKCNGYFHYLDSGDHFTCQNLLRCTIQRYCFLDVNYISIKLLKNIEKSIYVN